MLARPVDEVPDDEEVAGEVFFAEEGELFFEALAEGLIVQGAVAPVTANEALLAEAAKVVIAVTAVGRVVGGVAVNAGGVEADVEVAAVGDVEGGVAGLRQLVEEGAHFLGGLEMDFRGVGAEVGVVDGGAEADADENVMALVVLSAEEMHVVGGHGFEAVFFSPLDELARAMLLLLQAVVHEFEEKMVRSEDVAELAQAVLGLFGAAGVEELVDLAAHAATEADDALAVLAQRVLVNARGVEPEAVEVGFGDEAGEVFVAGEVFGKERQMGGALAAWHVFVLVHGTGSQIDLAAKDGF